MSTELKADNKDCYSNKLHVVTNLNLMSVNNLNSELHLARWKACTQSAMSMVASVNS